MNYDIIYIENIFPTLDLKNNDPHYRDYFCWERKNA